MFDKVKDPVCGMKVNASSALKSAFDGKIYSFCSENCRDQFDKEPEKYVSQQSGCCGGHGHQQGNHKKDGHCCR